MAELKPCPFCGREDIHVKIVKHDGYDIANVFCINCGAQIRAFNSKEAAIKKWNRRADDGKKQNHLVNGI